MITQLERIELESGISLAIGELFDLKDKLDRFNDFSDKKVFSDFQSNFVKSFLATKNGITVKIFPSGSINYEVKK